jgi:hypothetical protein
VLWGLAVRPGVTGLGLIVRDSGRRGGARRAINGFFVILGVALMALGTIIVVTFDPSKWPAS